MATKEGMIEKYQAQLDELGVSVKDELLSWTVDRVGPANYNADGQLVAASDPEEVTRVYTNFVADELAETDKEKGMEAIHAVLADMSDITRKYRAVVYYLLAVTYGK
jgi:hypothetical protein